MEWIARQLGHSDNTMFKKHYGKWIPKDAKRQAGFISEMLGLNSKEKDNKGLARTGER
jgi:integrase